MYCSYGSLAERRADEDLRTGGLDLVENQWILTIL